MAFLDMFFGPSKGEVRAALQLKKTEERMLRYEKLEEDDLPYHITRSQQRQDMLLIKFDLLDARSKRRDDRNLMALVIMALIVILSKTVPLDVLGAILGKILGLGGG